MMDPCVFCGIVAGDIPADVIWRGEGVTAFTDLSPQAPQHVLVVPDDHIASLAELRDDALAAALLGGCAEVAERLGVKESGYRVVTNVGSDGGQSVDHLHFHVLGGRVLTWPPG